MSESECVCVYVHMRTATLGRQEGVRSPDARVTGSWELLLLIYRIVEHYENIISKDKNKCGFKTACRLEKQFKWGVLWEHAQCSRLPLQKIETAYPFPT